MVNIPDGCGSGNNENAPAKQAGTDGAQPKRGAKTVNLAAYLDAERRKEFRPVMRWPEAEEVLRRCPEVNVRNAVNALGHPRSVVPISIDYFRVRGGSYVETRGKRWVCSCSRKQPGGSTCVEVAMVAKWMLGRDRRQFNHLRRKGKARDWEEYNAWKLAEAPMMPRVIATLAQDLAEDERPILGQEVPRGAKPISDCDQVFAALARAWTQTPLRGLGSAMRTADFRALVGRKPSYNSTGRWLAAAETTEKLQKLLRTTASWFSAKETALAIDATGIGCGVYSSYYEAKVKEYSKSKEVRVHRYVMASIVGGIDTHCIAAIDIWAKKLDEATKEKEEALDSNPAFKLARRGELDLSWMQGKRAVEHAYFEPLVRQAKLLLPGAKKITGDKAYGENECYEAAESLMLDPWLRIKDNAIPGNASTRTRASRVIMHHARPAEFMANYAGHQNIETINHMIKSNVGRNVRSRTYRAIINEVLSFAIVHNLLQAIRHDVCPPLPDIVQDRLVRWHLAEAADLRSDADDEAAAAPAIGA